MTEPNNVVSLRSEAEVYLTRRQVASRLGIGLTKLDELVRDGMPSYSWGLRVRRFRFSEVDRWLRERSRGMAATGRIGSENRPRAAQTAGATATEGKSDAA